MLRFLKKRRQRNAASPPGTPAAAPRRRWYQFSLRSLLILVTGVSILLSCFAVLRASAERQRRIVSEIREHGGGVEYDYQLHQWRREWAPQWVRNVLESDYIADVASVALESRTYVHYLRYCPRIERLVLTGSDITDEDLYELSLPRLRELLLCDVSFSADGLRQFGARHHVEHLFLASGSATDATIAGVEGFKTLRALEIEDCPASDEVFCSLKELAKLEGVSFRDAQVTGTGFRHLLALSNLQWLQFVRTPVQDESLEVLQRLPRLQYLQLMGAEVSDSGLVHLKTLTGLKTLDLRDTLVTPNGVASLQGQLSTCAIRSGKTSK